MGSATDRWLLAVCRALPDVPLPSDVSYENAWHLQNQSSKPQILPSSEVPKFVQKQEPDTLVKQVTNPNPVCDDSEVGNSTMVQPALLTSPSNGQEARCQPSMPSSSVSSSPNGPAGSKLEKNQQRRRTVRSPVSSASSDEELQTDAENLLQNDSENSYIIDRASAMIATRMSDEESDIDNPGSQQEETEGTRSWGRGWKVSLSNMHAEAAARQQKQRTEDRVSKKVSFSPKPQISPIIGNHIPENDRVTRNLSTPSSTDNNERSKQLLSPESQGLVSPAGLRSRPIPAVRSKTQGTEKIDMSSNDRNPPQIISHTENATPSDRTDKTPDLKSLKKKLRMYD